MADKGRFDKEKRQVFVIDLISIAERLSVIAVEIQDTYGRDSDIGLEAQRAAETVSLFAKDLAVVAVVE